MATRFAEPEAFAAPLPPAETLRICFLFNAQLHQVPHGLATAVALSRRPGFDVEICVSSTAHLRFIEPLLPRFGRRLPLRLIGSPLLRGLARLSGTACPPKSLTLRAAAHELNEYDAIVVPERTSLGLRRLGVTRPRFIHIDHGAGDRAIGYEERIRDFDFVLVAGEKQRHRMMRRGLIDDGSHAIVGYPKFEAADAARDKAWRPFPASERQTVLYNPHFDPALSSWHFDGIETIGRILADGRFDLIFAPHLRLCDGRQARASVMRALRSWLGHPRLHVDVEGRRLIDMSYTEMADVYLGDVSSQVYEFLRRPRPCLFLNSHGVRWQGDENYAHWRFGEVVNGVEGLIPALACAGLRHARYRRPQIAGFRATMSMTDTPASERAAQAIFDYCVREIRTK